MSDCSHLRAILSEIPRNVSMGWVELDKFQLGSSKVKQTAELYSLKD